MIALSQINAIAFTPLESCHVEVVNLIEKYIFWAVFGCPELESIFNMYPLVDAICVPYVSHANNVEQDARVQADVFLRPK
jgi:hypothetical protein